MKNIPIKRAQIRNTNKAYEFKMKGQEVGEGGKQEAKTNKVFDGVWR